MKNWTQEKKWLLATTVIASLVLVYGLIIAITVPFKSPLKEVLVNKLASTKMPFIGRGAYYPLYFTIQSNIMVMIYLLLRTMGILKPNEKKSHKIIEGVVLLNIFVTFFIYWGVLSWFSSVWENAFKAIQSFGHHFIMPSLMFVIFYKFSLKSEKQMSLSYKDFYWFIIYPLVWLLVSIIIYFSTIQDIEGLVHIKDDKVPTDLGNWKLANGTVTSDYWTITSKTRPIYTQTFKSGWAIYFFFDFKNTPAWLSTTVTLGIAALFVLLSLLVIKTTKKKKLIPKN